ncbi:MAG: response regulator [Candidatus Eiseniibacteriota bacterium]
MSTQRSILLVASARPASRVFQHVVACDPHLRLRLANDAFEAMSQVASEPVDMVVLNAESPGIQPFDLARQLRELNGMADAGFALILSPAAAELKIAAIGRGIEEFLNEPLDPVELRAALHRLGRVRELVSALGEAREDGVRLERRLEESVERAARLLAELIETRRPGASDRGDRIASLAARVAGRFGIPDSLLPDMARAAQLQELGYLSLSDEEYAESARGSAPEAWRYVMVTAAVLLHFDGFKGAAEVVRGISEHWDGSGTPDHVLSGQIPLRSRILRLLIDYT